MIHARSQTPENDNHITNTDIAQAAANQFNLRANSKKAQTYLQIDVGNQVDGDVLFFFLIKK